jgi:hypothetical protein
VLVTGDEQIEWRKVKRRVLERIQRETRVADGVVHVHSVRPTTRADLFLSIISCELFAMLLWAASCMSKYSL